MSVLDYIKMLRPGNCLMAAIAVFMGYAIASHSITFTFPLAFAMLSAFLVCGGGQAINDYFDWKIDAKIRPDKPIPAGRIKPFEALAICVFLFSSGIALSTAISKDNLAMAFIFSLALFAYSAVMQKAKFVGNLVVAAGTAAPLVYGAAVIGRYDAVLPLSACAFLVNYGREITKDFEDIKADKGTKKTLPMILPEGTAKGIIIGAYFSGITIAFWVYAAGLMKGIPYLAFTAISATLFARAISHLLENKYIDSQKESKKAMIAALIAFLLGGLA